MKKIDLAYIIDDDDILVMLVKMLIKQNPLYESSQAFFNGEDAITYLHTMLADGGQLPDVILLDLNMPIMDGWQFLDAFVQLKLEKQIPVFIATSSIDPKDIEKSKEYPPVKGYIKKPVKKENLDMIFSEVFGKAAE